MLKKPEPFTLAEVVAFLCGVAPLDGVWFGEEHPAERGAFWWRKHLREAAEPDALRAALGVAIPAPRLGWIVREKRNARGELVDCFVEAPKAESMAYGLEVLGDDYTGYGDLEGKLRHCQMIVAWANAGAKGPDMAELKPCPFCGGKAIFGCEYGLTRMHYHKRCTNCGAKGPSFPEDEGGQSRAEAAWNERAHGVDLPDGEKR